MEHALQYEVIPFLSGYQERLKPELSLAEIVNSTGKQLKQLDRSVVQMTSGMSSSLAGLGERIRSMLTEFGAFQKQYAMINDWVGTLKDSTKSMTGAADELKHSGERVRAPIDEINETLRAYMDKQVRYENIEVVEGLLSSLRSDVEGVNTAHLSKLEGLLVHQREQIDKSHSEHQTRSQKMFEEVSQAATGLSEAAGLLKSSAPGQTQETLRMLTDSTQQLRSTLENMSKGSNDRPSTLVRSMQAAAGVVFLVAVVGGAAYGGGRLASSAPASGEGISIAHRVVGDSLTVTFKNQTSERLNAAMVEFVGSGSGQTVTATEAVYLPGVEPDESYTLTMSLPSEVSQSRRFFVRAIPMQGFSSVSP